MICSTCNNEAHHVHVSIDEKGKKTESCNRCGSYSTTWRPDVYWPGHPHTNPNITDRMGREILLTSPRHKAQVMREQGLSEAGDRYHGSVAGNTAYFLKGDKKRG